MVSFSFTTVLLALALPIAAAPTTAAAVAQPIMHLLSTRPALSLASDVPLRIMPLGASITYGTASTDGNGYRSALRSLLVSSSSSSSSPPPPPPPPPVNMVGSRRAGTMRDNDVEGWPGLRIEQVHAKAMDAAASVPRWRPNLVLINAGTNDATQAWNVSAAGARMEALLRDLWRASPRAVVVLSTLLVNKQPDAERNVRDINAQFVALADRLRAREGRRVVLVDMQGPGGPGYADLADDTHPNDAGYRKMAGLWYRGILEAAEAGWLQPPEPVAGVPDDGAA